MKITEPRAEEVVCSLLVPVSGKASMPSSELLLMQKQSLQGRLHARPHRLLGKPRVCTDCTQLPTCCIPPTCRWPVVGSHFAASTPFCCVTCKKRRNTHISTSIAGGVDALDALLSSHREREALVLPWLQGLHYQTQCRILFSFSFHYFLEEKRQIRHLTCSV